MNIYILKLAILSLTLSLSNQAWAGPACAALFEINQTTVFLGSAISVKEIEPSSTLLLRMTKPDGFSFKSGQAIKMTLQASDGPQFRYFSIASSAQANYLEFAMKPSDSTFKEALIALKTGDPIGIDAPIGSLNFDPKVPAVFIAGGIGITPFRSILEEATESNIQTPMTLLYSNHTIEETAFRDEFDQMAADHTNIKLKYVIGNTSAGWSGPIENIDKDYLEKLIQTQPQGSRYYLVGSPGMVQAIQATLIELGIMIDHISHD